MDQNIESEDSFFKKAMKAKFRPKNEYQLGTHLLDTYMENDEFSELINKDILLSNISDDKILRLIQIETGILIHLFDMQKREPDLKRVFDVLYHKFRAELLLTRTKNGDERNYMAAIGIGRYKTLDANQGFGQQIEAYRQEEEQEGFFNQIKEKFKGGRK